MVGCVQCGFHCSLFYAQTHYHSLTVFDFHLLSHLLLLQMLLLELKPLQDKEVEFVIKLQSVAKFHGHLLISIRVRICQWKILEVKMVKDIGEPAGHEGLHDGEGEVPLLDNPHHTVPSLM